MLTEKQVIPLCQQWAMRFLRQASIICPTRKEAYDELYNIAYTIAKPLDKIEGASTWIMWSLVSYIETRKKDPRAVRYHEYIKRYQSAQTPLQNVVITEEREKLGQALMTLDPEETLLVSLRFSEEKNFDEIGVIIGCSRRWASILLNRVIDKLREEMKCE